MRVVAWAAQLDGRAFVAECVRPRVGRRGEER